MIRAALVKDGKLLKKAPFPRIKVEKVVGLEKGLEWLIVNELPRPKTKENESLVKKERITSDPHPDYTDFNQYQIYYELVKTK